MTSSGGACQHRKAAVAGGGAGMRRDGRVLRGCRASGARAAGRGTWRDTSGIGHACGMRSTRIRGLVGAIGSAYDS